MIEHLASGELTLLASQLCFTLDKGMKEFNILMDCIDFEAGLFNEMDKFFHGVHSAITIGHGRKIKRRHI